MADPHDLQRFINAQASVYGDVIEELSAGRKRSHWMWFIFPQIDGLGSSAMAKRYAIHSRTEAAQYLTHDTLGARLRECVRLLRAIKDRSIHEIMGSPDDMKLRSSMTLFDALAPDDAFADVLNMYYPEGTDRATLDILARWTT
jgi:uncharacterized protein (DUF1810 family)